MSAGLSVVLEERERLGGRERKERREGGRERKEGRTQEKGKEGVLKERGRKEER